MGELRSEIMVWVQKFDVYNSSEELWFNHYTGDWGQRQKRD